MALGQSFTLIEAETLASIDLPEGAAGGEARVLAIGIGDAEAGSLASAVVTGEALRPPSPVHLTARESSGGDLEIGWVRRSRAGWTWSSGNDAPLGEEIEAYQVEILRDGLSRAATVVEPRWTYTAADRAADGSGPVTIGVVQFGMHGPSRPARLAIA